MDEHRQSPLHHAIRHAATAGIDAWRQAADERKAGNAAVDALMTLAAARLTGSAPRTSNTSAPITEWCAATVDALQATTEAASLRDDGGHHRPAYDQLALWLVVIAASASASTSVSTSPGTSVINLPRDVRDALAMMVDANAQPLREHDIGTTADLWRCVIALAWQDAAALQDAEATAIYAGNKDDSLLAAADRFLASPGRDGSLHVADPEESPDAWTFDELVGVHALHALCRIRPSDSRRSRLHEVCQHHLECTQPDYTTTQPWGAAGFMMFDDTAIFAEQQLLDLLSQSGRSRGDGRKAPDAIALLLLADIVVAATD